MHEDTPQNRPRGRSRAWTDVAEERGGGLGVAGFAVASLGAHLLLSFALPAMASVVPRSTWDPAELAFFEMAPLPPPEPMVEPEPVVEPEREPVRERVRTPEPEPEPEVEPESEVEPELATVGTPDAAEEVPDSVPEVAQATVASTEGGLAVGVPGGEGSDGAARGRRHEGPVGTVAPSAPSVDTRALVSAWQMEVRATLAAESGLGVIARRMRLRGLVVLGVTVDAHGRVVQIRVKSPSDQPTLDATVVEHYQRVQTVPAPPSALGRRLVEIRVPVAVGPEQRRG